jgi:hypothetical protein
MRTTLLVCSSLVLAAMLSMTLPGPVLAGGIGVSPSTLSFGSVTVNSTSSAGTVIITNGSRQSISVLRISSNLPEFLVSGLTLPVTVGPRSSVSFNVTFIPDAALTYSGTVIVKTSANNGGRSVSVSGTGIPAPNASPTYSLTPSASALNFGSILVGTAASLPVSVTNTGTASVTVSQVTTTGTAFVATGFSGSVTLAAGQSLSLAVSFTPPTASSASGSLSVVSTATNSPATVTLSGTGIQPKISAVPTSANFGNVSVGVANTQSLTITNPGTANLTISQAAVSGTGFSYSGMTLPLTIAPGGSYYCTVQFAPTTAGTFPGTLTLTNNSPTPSLSVPLSGTGVSQTLLLNASPTTVNFGTVNTGASVSQIVTLTNAGNSSVSLSTDSVTGTGFTATGLSLPLSLAAGQSTSFTVAFAPTATGSFTGSVSVSSNATNSPTTISLSASGATPVSHTVAVSWTPSSSTYAGFNVYRSSVSGGPYTRIDSFMVSAPSYTDSSVTSGKTYYYVATEVDSTGMESAYSNESSASIP